MGTNRMVKIVMDGRELQVEDGITILDAANANNIRIPTLCHHPALSSYGGCRLCLVEVNSGPRLLAACVTPIREDMQIVTANDRINETRRTILEFLFAERNHFCMFCGASGDCELQKLAYEFQLDHLTVQQSFDTYPTDITSPYMALDHNRCVLCGRCVRACAEISGAKVLNFHHRGHQTMVGFDLDEKRDASNCASCGACQEVCPTGALFARTRTHYAVTGHHPEKWTSVEAACPECGALCPATFVVDGEKVIKVKGIREGQNGRPDHGQLCHRGRFGILNPTGRRIKQPVVRAGTQGWREESWETALDMLSQGMKEGRGSSFGLISSRCSNEALYLFREVMKYGWRVDYLDTLDGEAFRSMRAVYPSLSGASWSAAAEADLIMLIGPEIGATHPIMLSLARRAVFDNGAVVIYAGAEESGNSSGVIRIPLSGALEAVIQVVADVAGEAMINARNPVVVVGPDQAGGLTPTVQAGLSRLFSPLNQPSFVLLKPAGNSAAAWKLGLAAEGKPSMDREFKSGLVMLGGESSSELNPLAVPDATDFLAVISPYFPDGLADRAEVILPRPIWLEERGAYASLDGRSIANTPKVLPGPDDVWETTAILSALAKRAGLGPLFRDRDVLAITVAGELPGAARS